MMSSEFRRYLIFPVAFILIGCYLMGIRLYQNRQADVVAPITTLSPQGQEELVLSQEKVNLNTATKEDLLRLNGVGPVMAERILAKREELGGFGSLDQLKEISGIGDKVFEDLKNDITLD